MEDLNQTVAGNLKKIREERKLSLDRLAELTGVSKSMLRQIEVGDSSPTIATVWKIANGLKISFTALFSAQPQEIRVVKKQDITPLVEDNGKYRLYPFFPIEEGRSFEIYTIEIDRGGYLSAEPHPNGTQEFLTVIAGEITVRVGNQEYTVAEEDAIQFRADRSHAYHNTGNRPSKANLVIFYP